jgi:23S rRNA (uracil1939-C5)-methyltransferase
MTAEAHQIEIQRLGSRGEGIAHHGGRPLYVAATLPGEIVSVTETGSEHIAADTIVRASPDRIDPVCRHFGTCGGCQLQHMATAPYLAWKRNLIIEAFAARGIDVVPEPVRVVSLGARRRAVLTAHRTGRRTLIGFHAARSHDIVAIEECPVMVPEIVRALPTIAEIAGSLATEDRPVRATVLAADNGLDVAFEGEGRRIAAKAIAASAAAMTQARILRLTVDGAPMLANASPVVRLGTASVIPPPGCFLQASAEAEAALVAIVLDAVGKSKRVADLFCGVGTFTFHLARRARVLAVDSDKASIAALDIAARATPGLKPIETRRRDLFTDPLSPLELAALDAVVFDPPRAGAAAQAAALARSKIKTVVAVSCNPATLARDVRLLIDGGYKLASVTPVDQFVYSAHIEAVAVLRR